MAEQEKDQTQGDDITTDETLNRDADKVEPTGDTSGQPVEGGLTEHQEGAPEQAVEVVEKAEEAGYIGDGAPDKADYSQANPAVMNGGS